MIYKTGQLIKASVNNLPLVSHYGIVLVDGIKISVVHNTLNNSTVTDSLDDYFKTRKLISVSNTHLMTKTNTEILERFNTVCNREYDLFNYNCEHFVDCMLVQTKNSEQGWEWIACSILVLASILYFIKS